MITIILILIAIQLLLPGKNSGVLGCGLIGFVGKDTESFNREKFNILGIANEKRGVHSCGISVDGELFKGVHGSSRFTDFIRKEYYPNPKEIPVVIGHTRQATQGTHSKDNAHPFKFEFEDENYVIGAHNGVIRNDYQLATEYGIEKHSKIDSQILLEILANGDYKVLQEYSGYAALLIYSSSNPGSLWVWRGASKEFRADTSLTAERPLFFYKDPESGIYISSIEESLDSIVNNQEERDNNIFEFHTNHLYEIDGTGILNRYPINRDDKIRPVKVHKSTAPYDRSGKIWCQDTLSWIPEDNNSANVCSSGAKTTKVETSDQNKINNIHYEKIVFDNLEQDIFYENLRYKNFEDGSLVTGICIFIDPIGFVKICDSLHDFKDELKDFVYIDEKSKQDLSFGDISHIEPFYFYEGVILRTELDYTACRSNKTRYAANYEWDHKEYSSMSIYPIIDIDRLEHNGVIAGWVSKGMQSVTFNGKPNFSDTISPIGSFCTYTFLRGNLVEVKHHSSIHKPISSSQFVDMYDDSRECKTVSETLTNGYTDEETSIEFNPDFDESIEEEITNLDGTEYTKLNSIRTETGETLVILKSDVQGLKEGPIKKALEEFFVETQNRFKVISDGIIEAEKTILTNINK